jgi:predicted alpha-1,2-mannosidase
MYSNISGWDIYRSELPLVAMIDPRVASDLASSMVADEHQSGYLPKWPVLQGQNDVMVGDPADPLIAEAYAFGARQFDTGAALEAMVKGATVSGASANGGYVERPGLSDMKRLGYVPYDDNVSVIPATVFPAKVWGTASTTLEYATDDFTIARLAAATGQGAVCRRLASGSGDWANLLDRATATLRPRYSAGGFATDDGPASGNGFVEGSERQYQWAVPQDVAGLVSATGGRRAAVGRLTDFFGRLNAGPDSVYAYLGDEPDLSVPYVYDWLGRPDLASATVRRALLELYGSGPDGYPGNDDGGQMASWWVLGALGIYPAVPGTGTLTLGAPLFTEAEVRLAHGTLNIKAPGAGLHATTVSHLTVDGRSTTKAWVDWSRIDRGATVAFTFGRRAGVGTAGSSAPPSYSVAQTCRP